MMVTPGSKWPFMKGMYFYCIFYLEDIIRDDMDLLYVRVGDDYLSVSIDSKGELKAKLLNISKPILLCKITSKKWISLKFHYFLKSGLISSSY